MKTKMIFVLAVASGISMSCQRMKFAQVSEDVQSSLSIPLDPVPVTPEPPVTPPPPVVVPVKPQPVLSAGACAADSSTILTSCQTCQVPLNPPAPPQFSQKGQSLIDIMAIGCSVPNKSAPVGYKAPTRDELIQRLNRLSPTFYPDTNMSAQQLAVIEGLKSSSSMQNKMFGGLWYQPPLSDAFETYFGIEVGEAVYQLCYQSSESKFTPTNTTELHSKQYLDCTYNIGFGCTETTTYKNANTYRNQLRAGMLESINNPYVAPPPTPSKNCQWEKYDGYYDMGGPEQVAKWLVSSQKVSLEVKGPAGRCDVITSLPTGSDIPTGEVVMSAYVCK